MPPLRTLFNSERDIPEIRTSKTTGPVMPRSIASGGRVGRTIVVGSKCIKIEPTLTGGVAVGPGGAARSRTLPPQDTRTTTAMTWSARRIALLAEGIFSWAQHWG